MSVRAPGHQGPGREQRGAPCSVLSSPKPGKRASGRPCHAAHASRGTATDSVAVFSCPGRPRQRRRSQAAPGQSIATCSVTLAWRMATWVLKLFTFPETRNSSRVSAVFGHAAHVQHEHEIEIPGDVVDLLYFRPRYKAVADLVEQVQTLVLQLHADEDRDGPPKRRGIDDADVGADDPGLFQRRDPPVDRRGERLTASARSRCDSLFSCRRRRSLRS